MTMMGYIVLLGKRDRDGAGRDGRSTGGKGSDGSDGMRNSPAPVGKGSGLPGPEGGPHPPSQGFINGAVVRAPSGLETKVDLINGHSAKAQMRAGDPTLGSGRGARRRRAARRNLVERAALHVPGEHGS